MKILVQLHLLRLSQKKSSLVSGNRPSENFYYSPARIVECIAEYIFLISKNKQAEKVKQSKKTKKQKKLKKTREYLRKID